MEMKCPNCNSKDIGKIGVNQYYCWGCYIEMTVSEGMINTHQVEEDGSLVRWTTCLMNKIAALPCKT